MSETKEILWSELTHFNDKQKEAEAAVPNYKYLLYGGAVGGGKSYWIRWMLVKLLLRYYLEYGQKHVRVGLFCEDYPALKDRHVSKMLVELPTWLGELHKGDSEYVLAPEYGSGVIALRNLDDPGKYASSEFAVVAVDEITKNKKEVFDLLRTRMRWAGIPDVRFISGTNPGSVGHAWVKKIWIDKEFELNEKEQDEFKYIRATAHDNSANLDASYFLQLEGLPEKKRKAFLMGDWNLFEGQYFSEWDEDIHTVDPFTIPESWRKFGGYDHGRAKPACFKWYALDQDANVWCYREFYVNKEDGSSRWEADMIAKEVASITRAAGEQLEYVVVDSAVFTKTGNSETIAEILQKNGMGKPGTCIPIIVPCQKGAGSRVAGWTTMHQYLHHDTNVAPKIHYFKTCVDSIRTLPTLVYSERDVEDLDSDGEDHAADVDRYFLQTLKQKKASVPQTHEQHQQSIFEKKLNKVAKSDSILRLDRFANL